MIIPYLYTLNFNVIRNHEIEPLKQIWYSYIRCWCELNIVSWTAIVVTVILIGIHFPFIAARWRVIILWNIGRVVFQTFVKDTTYITTNIVVFVIIWRSIAILVYIVSTSFCGILQLYKLTNSLKKFSISVQKRIQGKFHLNSFILNCNEFR